MYNVVLKLKIVRGAEDASKILEKRSVWENLIPSNSTILRFWGPSNSTIFEKINPPPIRAFWSSCNFPKGNEEPYYFKLSSTFISKIRGACIARLKCIFYSLILGKFLQGDLLQNARMGRGWWPKGWMTLYQFSRWS